jgi:NAD(P)-dependent dehydrogenase (short-subunit alcohol dehydrogenase family)
MRVKLKPVAEQVVVITGASSGIGLATVRLAAERGARLVLVSRDEEDLEQAAGQARSLGAEVAIVVGDVADEATMQRAAQTALERFGRIDTWINNAGVSVYGRLEEVAVEDARRLFDTNYWGVVHGSLAALPHLRKQGGALINVGSVVSDTAMPLQGHYSASKHAVKGFTDALRIELEKDGAPVSVTLIKPTAIDTPYTEHARNYMDVEPKLPPPVYAPTVVAKAVLACAERPMRDVYVGGGAKVMATMERWAPRFADRYKEAFTFDQQRAEHPRNNVDTLYEPVPGDARLRGSHRGHVMGSSLYTSMRLSPVGRTLLRGAAVGLALALVIGAGNLLERSR